MCLCRAVCWCGVWCVDECLNEVYCCMLMWDGGAEGCFTLLGLLLCQQPVCGVWGGCCRCVCVVQHVHIQHTHYSQHTQQHTHYSPNTITLNTPIIPQTPLLSTYPLFTTAGSILSNADPVSSSGCPCSANTLPSNHHASCCAVGELPNNTAPAGRSSTWSPWDSNKRRQGPSGVVGGGDGDGDAREDDEDVGDGKLVGSPHCLSAPVSSCMFSTVVVKG